MSLGYSWALDRLTASLLSATVSEDRSASIFRCVVPDYSHLHLIVNLVIVPQRQHDFIKSAFSILTLN
jgi:hypothetical protein